jgi:hypothetical protein
MKLAEMERRYAQTIGRPHTASTVGSIAKPGTQDSLVAGISLVSPRSYAGISSELNGVVH